MNRKSRIIANWVFLLCFQTILQIHWNQFCPIEKCFTLQHQIHGLLMENTAFLSLANFRCSNLGTQDITYVYPTKAFFKLRYESCMSVRYKACQLHNQMKRKKKTYCLYSLTWIDYGPQWHLAHLLATSVTTFINPYS